MDRSRGLRKAFDMVEHKQVLREQNVPEAYIGVLCKLYSYQVARVQTGDTMSRTFELKRGVKQGDPVSALLFIAVMESCFRDQKKKWKAFNARRTGPGFGILVDDDKDVLTNCPFADDVLLVSTTKRDVRRVITDLEAMAKKYGLKMHVGNLLS